MLASFDSTFAADSNRKAEVLREDKKGSS